MPNWKAEIRSRLAGLRLSPTRENAIVEELSQHLDEIYEALLTSGATAAEARQQTLAELSSNERLAVELRRIERQSQPEPLVLGTNRRSTMIADVWQDLRYGARMLLKQKGITAIAVLSLALGIGANTALFSIVDAMLLKLLPVKEPQRLVLFQSLVAKNFNYGGYSGDHQIDPVTGLQFGTSFPYQSYQRMRERQNEQSALSDLFAFGYVSLNVLADGQAEAASGQVVTGNYHVGLGVQPVLGRLLMDEDDKPSAPPVAVLSYRYWQKRFGGDTTVVGKQINLNNRAFTVIGVTPSGFDGAGQVGSTQDVTIPLTMEPQLNDDPQRSSMYGAGRWWLRVMGRLQPGATPEQAQAQLEAAFQQSVIEHRTARNTYALAAGRNAISPLEAKDYPRLALASGSQGEMNSRNDYAPSLYLLLGVVGLVLLIACANVANLLLARATGRQKEIGVRLALGASRGRLMRQLLTESVLLAAAGGVLGLAFALWIKDGLLAVSDWGPRTLEPKLDWRVLAFTLGLSLLTGIVFGLAPAWRATRVDLTPALKDSGRSSSVASRSWLSCGLVVAQVALSLLLLIGAGLFVRTLVNLQRVDLGFNTKNLLVFNVSPNLLGYKDERLMQLYDRLTERLEAVPGATKVTFSGTMLLSQNTTSSNVYLRNALAALPDANGRIKETGYSNVMPGRENFLETMEIPLLAGRTFTRQDDARAPRVVVVNQTFANKFFPNENPVGKRFTFDAKKPDELEIVGLVKDAKYASQREENPSTCYLPWRQLVNSVSFGSFQIRFSGDPTAAIAAVRQAVRDVDANLPLTNVKTQVEQADESLRMERLFAKLVTLFGLLAQLLAAIGLFGVLAYAVAQRTQEIGIRMALGASQSDVLKMIVKQGMTLSFAGIALGLAGAYVLTKYLESWMQLSKMLYGIKPNDPLTYGVMAGLLTVVALIACYLPARRATKVDPMIALRTE
ncbi:MAG: ABC transporter permease [Blastocatellia bacterium]|nr:ABC transporter permease [Blastocatellia bacterium]